VVAVTAGVTVGTPSDRTVVLTRSFSAPHHLVFDAWTKPALLARWYGARGWNLAVAEVDLRVGGAWRFVWDGPDGATMAAGGRYREIDPPARLVYTESFDDHWYPGESLVSHDFAERDGTTTLTTTMLFDSRETRDLVVSSPMARGLAEGFDRLDALLSRTRLEPA
jgi:uncharacterized protein YndB with AHSA1/START domain